MVIEQMLSGHKDKMNLKNHETFINKKNIYIFSSITDRPRFQKVVVKKVLNQHVLNGRTDFLVKIIELLRFINRI